MTSEVILYLMKNVRLHRICYQNRLINKYARNKKAEISESQSPRVPESLSFLVTYRRTYVLNKYIIYSTQCTLNLPISENKLEL